MKRQLNVTCTANKKAKHDSLSNEDNNQPSTSKTLTEAEKKARRVEYNRKYKERRKEQQ
jgi:hypothetical protein